MADEVAAVPGLTFPMIVSLGENGIRTIDDLADLASDELIEMLPDSGLDSERANAIIMSARAHWFADEAAAENEVAAEPDQVDAVG